MDKLFISVLDIEVDKIKNQLDTLKSLGVKHIHLDVLDTSFCSNISFGISCLNYILSFDFIFDVHFMIQNPLKIIEKLNLKKDTRITVHSEEYLEIPNLRVGIALNPKNSIEDIKNILHKVSHVLIMGVEPGYGGQEFIASTVEKIKNLKNIGIIVGVDGGINDKNIDLVKDADFIVVGSFVTKSENFKNSLKLLLDKI